MVSFKQGGVEDGNSKTCSVMWCDVGYVASVTSYTTPHSSLWIIQLDSHVVTRTPSLVYSGIVLHQDMQVSTLHRCFHIEFHIPSFSVRPVVRRNTESQMKFRAVSMLFNLKWVSSTWLHSSRVLHRPTSFCTQCEVTLALLSPHSSYERHVVTTGCRKLRNRWAWPPSP